MNPEASGLNQNCGGTNPQSAFLEHVSVSEARQLNGSVGAKVLSFLGQRMVMGSLPQSM